MIVAVQAQKDLEKEREHTEEQAGTSTIADLPLSVPPHAPPPPHSFQQKASDGKENIF